MVSKQHKKHMNQSDIKYIIELLNDANSSEDWDLVIDAIDTLSEFLDDNDDEEDEDE